MTFATVINLALVLLCAGVLVQCSRMMRSLRAVQSGDLQAMVSSLDNVTVQARSVLSDLKVLLSTEGAANARVVESAEALRDELSVMVGIGNAMAERIVEATAEARQVEAALARSVADEEMLDEAAGTEADTASIDDADLSYEDAADAAAMNDERPTLVAVAKAA